ncbi:MAG: NifU family protein [Methylocystaceae bacterium]|nr:MAG: NifU family protein [Methylocystaceae bacterium]
MISEVTSSATITDAAFSKDNESERLRIISETLEQLRPDFQADGGDIELVCVEGPKVKVRLKGMCAACGASNETLGGIRRVLAAALGGGPVLVVPAL